MLLVLFSEDMPAPPEPEDREETMKGNEAVEDPAYPACGFELDWEWAEEDAVCQGRFKLETRTHLGVLHS